MERAHRQREAVFATIVADRADWDKATDTRRQLAVTAEPNCAAAIPGQYFSPPRSAEPEPATQSLRRTSPYPEQPSAEIDRWITDLTAGHRTFGGTPTGRAR